MNIAQTIRRGGYRGMPDDQVINERGARAALDLAVAQMREAIVRVNYESSVVTINPDAFADFVHDWLPTPVGWEEKISKARHG